MKDYIEDNGSSGGYLGGAVFTGVVALVSLIVSIVKGSFTLSSTAVLVLGAIAFVICMVEFAKDRADPDGKKRLKRISEVSQSVARLKNEEYVKVLRSNGIDVPANYMERIQEQEEALAREYDQGAEVPWDEIKLDDYRIRHRPAPERTPVIGVFIRKGYALLSGRTETGEPFLLGRVEFPGGIPTADIYTHSVAFRLVFDAVRQYLAMEYRIRDFYVILSCPEVYGVSVQRKTWKIAKENDVRLIKITREANAAALFSYHCLGESADQSWMLFSAVADAPDFCAALFDARDQMCERVAQIAYSHSEESEPIWKEVEFYPAFECGVTPALSLVRSGGGVAQKNIDRFRQWALEACERNGGRLKNARYLLMDEEAVSLGLSLISHKSVNVHQGSLLMETVIFPLYLTVSSGGKQRTAEVLQAGTVFPFRQKILLSDIMRLQDISGGFSFCLTERDISGEHQILERGMLPFGAGAGDILFSVDIDSVGEVRLAIEKQ